MIGRHRTIKIVVKPKSQTVLRGFFSFTLSSIVFANPLLPEVTKGQSWVEELKIFIYVMTFESVS